MKTLTAAAIMGISNLGLEFPSLDKIKYVENYLVNVSDAVITLAGHIIESDEMEQSFCEEVESWMTTPGVTENASFKVFEKYGVNI
jgi:hypothetical protein